MHPVLALDTLAVNLLDPTSLIGAFGLLGVLVIVFVETGLLVGFFMPGDSLLFTAGLFASAAGAAVGVQLPLGVLLTCAPICAFLGAQLGYYIGAKTGPVLFNRPDSRLFKREYVERAEYYFQRFGPAKAVLLARFIPIVRTFLNPVAGVLEMNPRTFLAWNAVGAVLWADGVVLVGYFLGTAVPGVDRYILPAIALIVVVSLIPVVSEVVRARRDKAGTSGKPPAKTR